MSENINITLSIDVPVDYVKEIKADSEKASADMGALLDKTIDAIKENSRMTEKNTKDFREFFEDLEEIVRNDTEYYSTITGEGSCKTANEVFDIGDEIVFIGNGCAVKDRISRVLVETEMGYQVYVDDAFRSMTELVERLKEDVHG